VNPSLDLEVRYLDLANLSSVVEFATSFTGEVTDEEDGSGAIAGLLNNAASLEDACTPTMDGFEMATQVNYLAPTLLTKLLLPQLEQSAASRIVHVSCPAAEKAQLKLEHLETVPAVLDDQSASGIGGSCDVFQRYATAKLLTVAFSTRLASELSMPRSNLGLSVFPVTTNVYDPVALNTEFASHEPAQPTRRRMSFMPQQLIRRAIGWALAPMWRRIGRMFTRSAETGARGLIHVATSPHLERVSGKLYSLSATGFTSQAGCQLPADQCGRSKLPPSLADQASIRSAWDATHVALSPWLSGVPPIAQDVASSSPAGNTGGGFEQSEDFDL